MTPITDLHRRLRLGSLRAASGIGIALLLSPLGLGVRPAAAQSPPAALDAAAGPAVRCAVSYGGTVHTIAVAPHTDPYAAEAVDIDERFRFKAVVRGQTPRIEAVKVYVYLETPRQPVLLHEARYLPPFSRAPLPGGFTGEHTVIAPPLERQLHYACTLP
ncbi:hypothetical protein [Xylophilus ampelinus]|nr:hypothetical protein [Xylophilus ampelinus]MCS4510321.1 hypothetical protein [Xylophilus ampelinus]